MVEEQGKCPKCGDELGYGALKPDDGYVYYPVDCLGCDYSGRECYDLHFTEFVDK